MLTVPITVHVTEEDNKQGSPGSCQTCPIALALHRATMTYFRRKTPSILAGSNQYSDVLVTGRRAVFGEGYLWGKPDYVVRPYRAYYVELPEEIQHYIRAYDNLRGTPSTHEIFSFTLDVPIPHHDYYPRVED